MEEKIVITESMLAKAFQMYNKSALDNPQDYAEIDYSLESARSQAKELISYLKDINEKL